LPVSASSATTRLYCVDTYKTLSIISGVFWKLPGRVPYSSSGLSSGRHSQATASLVTFDWLMSASGEDLAPP